MEEFDNALVRINGTLQFTSGYAISDGRLKKDIEPLERSLEAVLELQGVRFSWNTLLFPDRGFNEDRHIGLVAQEVEKVLPQVVHTNRDGYKSVAYDQIVPVLVGAVKEQQVMIESQRAIIDTQEAAIKAQEERMDFQQAQIDELRGMLMAQARGQL